MPVHVNKFNNFCYLNFFFVSIQFYFIKQSDVADGVMKILHNKDIKGVTYDFVG